MSFFTRLCKRLPVKLGQVAPVLPVVRLQGTIGLASPLRPGLTLASCATNLEKAFRFDSVPAVAIIINSPGGSPVQARLIYQRIRQLSEEHDKQVLVFVEDVAASGGYMIAVAGDEIIADPSSIVGSIGVISAGFGFVDLLERIGVERRMHTSGTRKGILDPFQPENPDDVTHLETLQQEIHEVFVEMVRARRGDVLNNDPNLFSGLFWVGETARSLGLVDDLGDLRSVARARFGDKVRLRLIGDERSLLPRRQGVGIAALGDVLETRQGLARDLVAALEERSLWSRYGL
ncbi:S49 family peptidase [Breoghania sp.]|uniref:S49 family peptidase n=1 Tax=Breoghania sp. TaxID=2065378 RepID=UPI0026364854|nr:S49 family peptidase [Breoghania sp.]MDJ0930321.1 S49 family peptidase [Breoghania sp.]